MGCLPLHSRQDRGSSGMVARQKLAAASQSGILLQVRCYPSDEGSESGNSCSQGACAGVPPAGPDRPKFSRNTSSASKASDCGRKSFRKRSGKTARQRLAAAAAAYKQLVSKKAHSEDSSLHDSNAVLQPRISSSSGSKCADRSAFSSTGAALAAVEAYRLEQNAIWASTVQKANSSSRASFLSCCLKPQCNKASDIQQPLAPVANSHTVSAPESITAASTAHAVQPACRGSSSSIDCGGSIRVDSVVGDGIINAPAATPIAPAVECDEDTARAASEVNEAEPRIATKTTSHLPLALVINSHPACAPGLGSPSDSVFSEQQLHTPASEDTSSGIGCARGSISISSRSITVMEGGIDSAPAGPPAESAVQCVEHKAIPAPDVPTSDSVSWSFGSSSEQNGRTHMEDRLLTAELTSDAAFAGAERAMLVGVFDGHAGSDTAQYLSSSLVGHLLAEGAAALQQDPAGSLERAVGRAEGELMASWDPDSGPASGSTLCMGLVLGSMLHVAHAGDSRAVLARSGRALQLTQDHKPSSAAEQQRIHAADPSAHVSSDGYMYGELGVSRGLGSAHVKADASKTAYIAAPEVRCLQLEARDDFLILASDGLWDVMSSSEAVTAARKSLAAKRDAAAAAAVLVERAKQMGSADNISVVVLLLHGRPITLAASNSRLFRRPAATTPAAAGEAAA